MTTNYKQQYQAVAAQYDRVWAIEQGQAIGESLEKWPFFQKQPSAHSYAINKLGRLEGKQVLELGCGAGYTTLELADQAAQVTAVDLSAQALAATRRMAQEKGLAKRVRTLQASAEALPVEAGSYDAIFAQNFLMHVAPEQVGRECWRVLKPGGQAVFVEPLDHHPLIKLYHRLLSPYKASQPHWYTQNKLVRLAEPFGGISQQKGFYLLSALASLRAVQNRAWKLKPAWFILNGTDQWLLRRIPKLDKYCWMAVVVLEKPGERLNIR